MQMVLQVHDGRFPFGEGGLKVEDRQSFTNLPDLQEKQRHMIKRNEMLNSPHVVKLLGVSREGFTLKYSYEYIPHSLLTYVRSKWSVHQNNWPQKKAQVLKKMGYEITMLVGFLARMRVETNLTAHSLGVTEAEKIKIFLGPKARMGIRSQLFLIAHYRKPKEELINYVTRLVQSVSRNEEIVEDQPPIQPTFPKNDNRNRDKPNPITISGLRRQAQDMNWGNSSQELISSFDWGKESSELQWGGQKIPERKPKKSMEKSVPFHNVEPRVKRKMSVNNLDFGPVEYSAPSESMRESRKKAKYSFNVPNPSPAFQGHQPEQANAPEEEDDEPVSPTKTKSIRIQLEQQPGATVKGKKRRDSYKVRITTYRQYEIEQPPNELFKDNEGDDSVLFDYFAKKAKQEAEQQAKEPKEESNHSDESDEYEVRREKMYQGENVYPQKRLSTEADPSFPSSSIHRVQKPEYPINSMCDVAWSPTSPTSPGAPTVPSFSLKLKKATSTQEITEKIRLARERSNQVIERIRQMKK